MYRSLFYPKEYLEHIDEQVEQKELERELKREIDKQLCTEYHYSFGIKVCAIVILIIAALCGVVWLFT